MCVFIFRAGMLGKKEGAGHHLLSIHDIDTGLCDMLHATAL